MRSAPQVAIMNCQEIPGYEQQRVAALHRYCVLDTPPEPAFDRLTHLAHHMLRTPTALISLVECERQWFKSRVGHDASETPLELSFCVYAVRAKDTLVVPDARKDARFADNPLVTGPPGIRFYVGAPLITDDGLALGTICAIDYEPRPPPDSAQLESLRRLADCVVSALEQRLTARELAARQSDLSERSTMLQTTINAVSQGIGAYDADLKLVARNDQFLTLLDLPPELGELGTPFEAISAHVAHYGGYGAGDPAGWVAARTEAVRQGLPHRLEIMRGDGRIIEVKGHPVPGGGRVTTYTDITEQRRHNEELERRIAEREAIAKLKNEFVSTVSHELRTPLTAISGALALLATGRVGTLPQPAEKMVAIAHGSSVRLIKLVDDILDVDRLESGKAIFHVGAHRIAPLVERAVAETAPFAEMFFVSLRLDIRDPDAMAVVDPDRLMQVVTNLLSNAAKFSKAAGEVVATVDRCDGQVRISVQDHGPGIPLEFRDRVFEKFAQADGSDRRQVGGSGLGLAVVKGIVDNLGGTVDFETEDGRGTTFHVCFPEWQENEMPAEPGSRAAS
jgi:signal transduction histidine kinase